MSNTFNLSDYIAERKKESVSIPNGAIIKAMALSIKLTNKGVERQSPLGGIGMKFAFLAYYDIEDGKTVVKPCIDYTDLKDIKFPIDKQNDDGSWERPGLMSMGSYATERMMEINRFQTVTNEEEVIPVYAYMISKGLGPNSQMPIMNFLGASGLFKDAKPETFGLKEWETRFPVFTFRRYTKWDYDWKDLDKKTKKPLPGAQTSFKETLTVWNRETEQPDLEGVDIEYLDAETAIAIADALNARQELKKAEKEISSPSPAASFDPNDFSAGNFSDVEDIF